MKTGQSSAPVFIVGLPRTGSKLMMNVINLNTRAGCHISNEIQFFGHSFLGRILQGRRGVMPIIESERDSSGRIDWEAVVDRLYSHEISGVHWSGLSAGWLKIPRSKLLKNLSETDGEPRAVYERILATQETEFQAYGDKSGPNLYFVDKLLEWFPNAKVIHTIRDPRAILTSQHRRIMLKVEHKGKGGSLPTRIQQLLLSPIVVLYVLTYWGYAMRVDRRFSRSHPDNYMSVQFEELVLRPEETTRRICDFLGVPWDAGILSPPKADSSFIDPRDVMKGGVDRGSGMDVGAVERWRGHIKPWMSVAFRIYGSLFYPRALERCGYLD